MFGSYGPLGQGGTLGQGPPISSPPINPYQGPFALAVQRWRVGTGILSVAGTTIAALKNVSFQGVAQIRPHILGTPGLIDSHIVLTGGSILKAEYADVIGTSQIFLMNNSNLPIGGILPQYPDVIFQGFLSYTVHFRFASIIPTGEIKMVEGGMTIGGLEIQATKSTLPDIY